MVVGLIPFGGDTNPYQRNLKRALESQGLQVKTFGKSNWIPLYRAVRSEIDLLHIDWPHSFYLGATRLNTALKRAMFLWQLRNLGSVPIIWTAHNLHTHNRAATREGEMMHALMNRINGLVALSHTGLSEIQHRWPSVRDKQTLVVPHGNYCQDYSTQRPQAESRAKLGLAASERTVLFIGRVQPYKGADLLIDAFRRINLPNIRLIIAGEADSTEYRNYIQQIAKGDDRISLNLRLLSPAEIELFASAADLIALPFREIFNSGTVVLAMSFGRPIIAPSLGAIPEMVPPGALFPFRVGDTNRLRDVLAAALQRDDLPQRGAEALRAATEDYSWDRVGRDLVRFYSRFAAR